MLAKGLREDSNYEALLIANEHGHFLVSPSVHELGRSLRDLAELVIITAADAVVAGLRRDPAIDADRTEFNAFAHKLFSEYVGDQGPIRIMLDRSCAFKNWFCEHEVRLREGQTTDGDRLGELIEGIRFGVFGQKAALMNDYRRKIERLGSGLARMEPGDQGTLFDGEQS